MKMKTYETKKYLELKETIYKLEEILLKLEDIAFSYCYSQEEQEDE